MKQLLSCVLLLTASSLVTAQTPTASPTPAAPRRAAASEQRNVTDLSEYGVTIQPDARLIVTMAALEAAGFQAQTGGVSEFRQTVREDIKNLDEDLTRRLRSFFQRNNRELEKASPAEQIARYVSLAYALGAVPELTAPARSADLPSGLLEVLDFAPLVREFHQKSGIAERLPEYLKQHQTYGDAELRQGLIRSTRDLAGYLNTRPQLIYTERVTTAIQPAQKNSKKPVLQRTEIRERERRFVVVPDLLAVPNTVKLRNIGDDYFAVIGAGVDPDASSEFRRAYLQFLVDPLVYKNAKEIAVQRANIRPLLDELRATTNANVSPDVYLAIARSLVIAADVRQMVSRRIEIETAAARQKIDRAKTPAEQKPIADKLRALQKEIDKQAFADLAEGYESGAVLAFFFYDRLREVESAGFDVANSLTDFIVTFDVSKERVRLVDNAKARREAVAARLKQREENRQQAATVEVAETTSPAAARRGALVKQLAEIDRLRTPQSYSQAERRLLDLLLQNPGEPLIFFALGRTASYSATLVEDDEIERDTRLRKAYAHYQRVLESSTDDLDPALRSNTHFALGQILEFENLPEAALQAFEKAIAIGRIPGGAFNEAEAAKKRLTGK